LQRSPEKVARERVAVTARTEVLPEVNSGNLGCELIPISRIGFRLQPLFLAGLWRPALPCLASPVFP
jgi:hypothetical protein